MFQQGGTVWRNNRTVMVKLCSGTVEQWYWNSVVKQWKDMVKQWNSDGGTVKQ